MESGIFRYVVAPEGYLESLLDRRFDPDRVDSSSGVVDRGNGARKDLFAALNLERGPAVAGQRNLDHEIVEVVHRLAVDARDPIPRK